MDLFKDLDCYFFARSLVTIYIFYRARQTPLPKRLQKLSVNQLTPCSIHTIDNLYLFLQLVHLIPTLFGRPLWKHRGTQRQRHTVVGVARSCKIGPQRRNDLSDHRLFFHRLVFHFQPYKWQFVPVQHRGVLVRFLRKPILKHRYTITPDALPIMLSFDMATTVLSQTFFI